jgi:aspartate ammonia-lyase
MNTNEVLANRAAELLGGSRGSYERVHPNDHVNMGQSTNDVFPTATRLALLLGSPPLAAAARSLAGSLTIKSGEFADVLKTGRTHLQDAVPMTLGQEFHGFATTLGEDYERLKETIWLLSEVNIGATAIGTGITADPRYSLSADHHLSRISGLDLETAPDLIESTSDAGAFMSFSGALKRSAVKLSKICNDLRLLSSGPQAGLGEINLPPRAAGSSIMPGKVNPIIPEVVNQVAFSIIGADATVTAAAEAGQLQLNAFEPVIANFLLQSITWLRQACLTLRVNCVDGITANEERLETMVGSNIGVITALTPHIGYAAAAALAKTALLTNRNVADLVVEAGLMPRDQVTRLLSPARLSGLETITMAIPIVDDHRGRPEEGV